MRGWWRDIWRDVVLAFRLLGKDRGFASVTVLTLAFGIGGSVTVFTIVNGMLLRGLPVDRPERIMSVSSQDAAGRGLGVSYLDFQDWRAATQAFGGLAAYSGASMNLTDEGLAPDRFAGAFVSAGTFALLGEPPILGRDFVAEDDRPGGAPVVILGSSIWKTRYGGDRAIIGRTVRINGTPTVVIGVMRDGFRFPLVHDVWQPLALLRGVNAQKRDVRTLSAFGRLRGGVQPSEAQAELAAIAARLSREYAATNANIRPVVRRFTGGLTVNDPWSISLGAVVVVLLIACANVANLLLARSVHRSREMAIRASLGATRWRLVRQLLVESGVLSTLAGVLGFGLAVAGVRVWEISLPVANWPYWFRWTIDTRVLTFLIAVSAATAFLFGLAPAIHLSKTNANELLNDGGRGGIGGIRARRWTNALVVAELALTLAVLTGAALMTRSLIAVYRADAVVDTANVLLAGVPLPNQKYPTSEQRNAFFDRLAARLDAVPAIASATLASGAPFYPVATWRVELNGRPPRAGDAPLEASYVTIGRRYFETLHVQLLRGRPFSDLDGFAGHESAIVNQRFVSMHFPNEDPIGQRIRLTNPASPGAAAPWMTIVGISPTIRQRYAVELDPVVYVPYRSNPTSSPVLMLRLRGETAAATAAVREEVRQLDSDQPLAQIMPLDQLLSGTQFANRVFTTLFSVFAGMALVLSAIGLYAVTAYSVRRRTQEIGVRTALGAQAGQVVWLFMRRAIVLLGIGLVIGLAGAVSVGRLMRGLLIQTSATDPVTLASIAALLIVVALTAVLWPARRAARLDPAVALRYD